MTDNPRRPYLTLTEYDLLNIKQVGTTRKKWTVRQLADRGLVEITRMTKAGTITYKRTWEGELTFNASQYRETL